MPSRMTAASLSALLAATLAALALLVAAAQPPAAETVRRAAVTVCDRGVTAETRIVIEGALP